MAPFLTLGQLITEACELFDPAGQPTRYFSSALKHGEAFRRKLITGTHREDRTDYLEVGGDRTAELPSDFVKYTRLGVLSDDELTIYPLLYDGSVPASGRTILQPADFPHEWMHLGGFRIDQQTHRIVCNSLVPEHTVLVLDYKTFGATVGEDIAIDPLAQSWGQKFILTELYKQKKDWASATTYAKDCMQEHELYKQAIRNFSLAQVKRVNHKAAGQRWK